MVVTIRMRMMIRMMMIRMMMIDDDEANIYILFVLKSWGARVAPLAGDGSRCSWLFC